MEIPSTESLRVAVAEYNQQYGEKDRFLWALATQTHQILQSDKSEEVVETFIWTIKRWWGLQGVFFQDRSAMVKAVIALKTSDINNKTEDFSNSLIDVQVGLVTDLVSLSKKNGALKGHFSWASKILHWLYPNKVPVYDAIARKSIAPLKREGADAYREITKWEFDVSKLLGSQREEFIGNVGPYTMLRVLDKYVWWEGKKLAAPVKIK